MVVENRRLIVLMGFAAVVFWAVASKADVPRWLSVMPLHDNKVDELANDCATLGNDTFVDGIAWSCPVNPEGDPVVDRAGIYVKR